MLASRLLGILTLAVCGACVPFPASAADTARGTVYVDTNGDGVRDRDEPGLGGVAVSNGLEVVESDAEGRWSLPVREGDVIFVVKPRDHRVPLDANRLPRFYYVHRPDGTPAHLGLRYAGLDPTGPLPDSIDFGLIPHAESDRFDVLLFADTQPQSHVELDYVRDDVLASLVGADVAFGMTLGDIFYDDLSLIPRYVQLIGTIGVPWYHVPGNHELNFLAPDDALSLESFQRAFGPTTYSFDHANAHFVVLDDVIYEGTPEDASSASERGNGSYYGGFTERQLTWLRRDLARVPADRLVILTMHVPLRTHLDPARADVNVLDREPLFEILVDREHLLAFAGHTHVVEHHYFTQEDGWAGAQPLHQHILAVVSGSWWAGPPDERGIPVALQRDGVPNGYSILTVDGNRASVRYRAASMPVEHQMRIGFDHAFHQLGTALLDTHLPGTLQAGPLLVDELDSTDVYVNLFNGGPRSAVWMRVGDVGPWVEMQRRVRRDPFVVEWMARYEDRMKGWIRPVPTQHLWTAALPPDLAPGAHALHVRAKDEYGAEHTGTRVFEVRQ